MPAYLLIIAAALSLVVAYVLAVRPLMSREINKRAFLSQILKLVKADNIDRAVKLCEAAPNSHVAALTRDCLEESRHHSKSSLGEFLASVTDLFEVQHIELDVWLKGARVNLIVSFALSTTTGLLIVGWALSDQGSFITWTVLFSILMLVLAFRFASLGRRIWLSMYYGFDTALALIGPNLVSALWQVELPTRLVEAMKAASLEDTRQAIRAL